MRTTRPPDYPGCPRTIVRARVRGDHLRETQWGIRDAVIAILGAIGLGLGAAIALIATGTDPGASLLVVLIVIPWVAMAGWPVLATRRWGNGPVLDLGIRLSWADLGWGVVTGVACLVAGTIAAVVTQLFAGDFTAAAADTAADLADSGAVAALWGLALVALFGAPLVEEMAFRGMLWAGLRRRGLGAFATGAIVSVAFALFHFEPTRIFVLLAVAAVLAVARERRAGLGTPIVGHAINNLPGAIGIIALA